MHVWERQRINTVMMLHSPTWREWKSLQYWKFPSQIWKFRSNVKIFLGRSLLNSSAISLSPSMIHVPSHRLRCYTKWPCQMALNRIQQKVNPESNYNASCVNSISVNSSRGSNSSLGSKVWTRTRFWTRLRFDLESDSNSTRHPRI